jgi:c-di-GMP-related signal transduction protein
MAQRTPEEGSVLLAAQPIYDNRTHIEAVELLYRNDRRQSALEVGEVRATSVVFDS